MDGVQLLYKCGKQFKKNTVILYTVQWFHILKDLVTMVLGKNHSHAVRDAVRVVRRAATRFLLCAILGVLATFF